ncbi:hypothetical protein J0S82_015404, partial [Galemys pyrenaicus]
MFNGIFVNMASVNMLRVETSTRLEGASKSKQLPLTLQVTFLKKTTGFVESGDAGNIKDQIN